MKKHTQSHTQKAQSNTPLNIVAIGGGTGLSSLLMGLKRYDVSLVAIVTVTDDGGSSGRLSREYGILPPGDIRNCLVSLAEQDNVMAQLFRYRFGGKGAIAGHSFGNLFIMAMADIFGSFEKGIFASSTILAIKGTVIPSTFEKVKLSALLENGTILSGETAISKSTEKIRRVFLNPSSCNGASEALAAIRKADVIVIGPGSLYTSIIPNLLIHDIARELVRAKARKLFVCNLMSQPGETDGYSVEEHLTTVTAHVGVPFVDTMLVNTHPIPRSVCERYAKQGSSPVVYHRHKAVGGVTQICGDFFGEAISRDAKYARHDPDKLAQAILKSSCA